MFLIKNGFIMENQPRNGQWSSYLGFIFATTGAAVGLGNIWKFPYIVGENGGGAFVFVYLVCILFIGVPLMMAEIMLGRAGKKNPALSMRLLSVKQGSSKQWQWVGLLGIIASVIILSYYSVIAGWALEYVIIALKGAFNGQTASQIDRLFENLVASPYQLAFWHTLIIVFTIAVVAMGVEKGLERAVKFLFPAMLALLLIIVGYSMSTHFFAQGIDFLFYPDFSKLTPNGVLCAVGHAFFTLSLGVGSIMIYGAYLPDHISVAKSAVFIAAADTLIALVAGLAIFPIVFAHGLMPSAGPGLIFKSLPLAFGHMPYGAFFGGLFFIMLVFAAFTSTISLLEPGVSYLRDTFKLSRVKAAFCCGFTIWLLGFFTIFSFNIWSNVKTFGHTFFELFDILTANFMLPITGILIAVYTGWVYKEAKANCDISHKSCFFIWRFCLRYITPTAITLIFLKLALGVI
jgi:NSS family neurotransmitter:Na+ symporter